MARDTNSNSQSSVSEVEKAQVEMKEETSSVDVSHINERRTLLWIDLRMLPILALMYSFSLIDRTNLSSTRVAGMGTALKLNVGERYSIVNCLFFVPYILLQIPGNVFIRRIGVRNWLTFIVISWGAIQLGMGFVKNWGMLVFCRTLLGAFEAGFFPALVFVISTWYKRHEVQTRLAAFYLGSITIGAFSPILAYALSMLHGRGGIAGWSWIFIIEGAVTIFLGILGYFFLPEFPDRNTFLSRAQTAWVLKRVEEDRGDSVPDEITMAKVLKHLGDWTIWCYGVMFACSTLATYMIAFFIPIILNGMKYSTTQSLLLSAPPYGPAVVSAMLFAWLSDRTRHRSGFIVIQALITITGAGMTAFAKGNGARYAGTFFLNAGASGLVPAVLAYGSNNVVSHSKRSVQSAVTVAWGGIGGILASTVFREKDAPHYVPGLWVTIGAQLLTIILAGVTAFHFRRQNKRSREGKLDGPLEGQEGFYYTI